METLIESPKINQIKLENKLELSKINTFDDTINNFSLSSIFHLLNDECFARLELGLIEHC